jgi:uncharacterized protein (UPF0548 family)
MVYAVTSPFNPRYDCSCAAANRQTQFDGGGLTLTNRPEWISGSELTLAEGRGSALFDIASDQWMEWSMWVTSFL